ncbi:DUF461 domain-containing protein [Streptomyces sp. N2-109]|uniref:DUF461 domain-containing protein n=1 Tax=Streptomyces gossypii TaxID=2883101 RepID=A0ABT2JY21_9ACTN|nr:DUF461 domain-containing protein [Streptomyces gossypii]MCT2592799.1 DUF461 domain-containing protein [Streptomyces gossypii]
MSSSLRRGTLAATVLALSAATLTACAAGTNAETLQVKPDNAAVDVGHIQVQAANVITTEGSEGPGPAAITAKIFNTGDKAETLQGITLGESGLAVQVTPAKGESLKVPAGGSLALGGKGNASAVIMDGAALENGSAPEISFDLSTTGSVKLRATVVPEEHDSYGDYGPTVTPTEPSPTASPEDESTTPGEETPGGETPGDDAEGQTDPNASGSPAPGASEEGTPAPGTSEAADAGAADDAAEGTEAGH